MRQLTQKKTTQILNWKAIVKVQVERNWKKSCWSSYGDLQLFSVEEKISEGTVLAADKNMVFQRTDATMKLKMENRLFHLRQMENDTVCVILLICTAGKRKFKMMDAIVQRRVYGEIYRPGSVGFHDPGDFTGGYPGAVLQGSAAMEICVAGQSKSS